MKKIVFSNKETEKQNHHVFYVSVRRNLRQFFLKKIEFRQVLFPFPHATGTMDFAH